MEFPHDSRAKYLYLMYSYYHQQKLLYSDSVLMLSDKYRSESLVYYCVQRKSYPASDALPLNPPQLLYNGTYHQKGR